MVRMNELWNDIRHRRAREIIDDYVLRGGPSQIIIGDQPELAIYDSGDDRIYVSPIVMMDDISMCSAIYHELAHSTGAKTRLNRPWVHRAAVCHREIALEEIIAEITAARLMRVAGLMRHPYRRWSSEYVRDYARLCREDGLTVPEVIARALPYADAATQYILGGSTNV